MQMIVQLQEVSVNSQNGGMKYIVKIGPSLGYVPNAAKSWIIVKDRQSLLKAQTLFQGTNVQITTQWVANVILVHHLEFGSVNFKEEYVKEKVTTWCEYNIYI